MRVDHAAFSQSQVPLHSQQDLHSASPTTLFHNRHKSYKSRTRNARVITKIKWNILYVDMMHTKTTVKFLKNEEMLAKTVIN